MLKNGVKIMKFREFLVFLNYKSYSIKGAKMSKFSDCGFCGGVFECLCLATSRAARYKRITLLCQIMPIHLKVAKWLRQSQNDETNAF